MLKLTKTRKITAAIMAVTVLLWVVCDIPTATNGTGSVYTLPAIPAALGALCGHWTIPNQNLFKKSWTGLYALLGIVALLGLWSATGTYTQAHDWLAAHSYYVLPSFYPVGGLLWGHGKSTKGEPKPPTTHRILP